ncbi:hypothetical protein Tco_1544109 [Tanacetum coccineum]
MFSIVDILPHHRIGDTVVDWYDLLDSELFSINEYDSLLKDLGFKDGRILFSRFRIPGKSLDGGLTPLMSDEDVLKVSLGKGNGVLIEEIIEDDDVENKNEASMSKVDDPVVWQQDNYHGDNDEEEITHLFVELEQLLEHVDFLSVELRESVVGVDPLVVVVDA